MSTTHTVNCIEQSRRISVLCVVKSQRPLVVLSPDKYAAILIDHGGVVRASQQILHLHTRLTPRTHRLTCQGWQHWGARRARAPRGSGLRGSGVLQDETGWCRTSMSEEASGFGKPVTSSGTNVCATGQEQSHATCTQGMRLRRDLTQRQAI